LRRIEVRGGEPLSLRRDLRKFARCQPTEEEQGADRGLIVGFLVLLLHLTRWLSSTRNRFALGLPPIALRQ
jgi:hypothetical protein